MDVRSAPYIPEADLMQGPYKAAIDELSEAQALALVNQTFYRYQSWRASNHDRRWTVSDSLYFGSVPQKLWPGTSVPRAALGIPIAFEQVDLAVSIMMQQIFGTGKDWFQVAADPGTEPLSLEQQQRDMLRQIRMQEAKNIEAHFRYLFRHSKNTYGHSARIEIEDATQSVAQYGNGVIMTSWDGVMKRPQLEWVDLRDLYIDPHCPSSNLQEARSIIHVRRMTVDQIDSMREDTRFKIPDREVLIGMSQNILQHQGDRTVQSAEAKRRVDYQPGTSDQVPLPSDNLIEVLVYVSRSRICWVLNRESVIYNDKNPYGVINYFMAPCYKVLKRAFAMSIAEVNEGNQLMSQGLMSGHLDEVNLTLFPPRSAKRGPVRTPSSLRWGPGTLNEYGDPKNDVVVHQPVGATTNIDRTLAWLESSAERRTGLNSTLAGSPRGSNLFRTTAGVQVASRPTRLSRVLQHIEDYILVPSLYFCYMLIRYHADPQDQLPGVDAQGEFTQVSASSFQAPVHFSMHAASDMLRREELAQAVPMLAQTLLAPQAQAQLTRIGKTVDFEAFLEMVQDATGTRHRYNLVRPLNQQEQQALQQPDPKTVAETQMAQQDGQIRIQMGQMKAEIEKLKAHLEYEADIQETEGKDAREILKIVADALSSGNVKELQQKLAIKAQEGQQKLAQQSEQHQLKMAQQRESTGQQMQLGQMKLQDQMSQAGQKMILTRLQFDNKLKMQKEQAEAQRSQRMSKTPNKK